MSSSSSSGNSSSSSTSSSDSDSDHEKTNNAPVSTSAPVAESQLVTNGNPDTEARAEVARSESPPSERFPSPGVAENEDIPPPQASDSDDDDDDRGSSRAPQKRSLISSSDEDDDEPKQRTKKNDSALIFGDDVSDSDDDQQKRAPAEQSDEDKSEGSIQGIRMYADPDEEEQPEEEQPPEIIESELPNIDVDFGDRLFYVKFPNFLSIETRPFDPEEYEDNEDDDNIDGEGRTRLKLKVENTIRWKMVQDEEGNDVPVSNAKVVRWSDGTMSLYLGKEIFDIQEMPVVSHTHLYVRQATGLTGKALFEHKLQFRPHSTDSHTHRKVTLNMADRTRKSGQVKILTDIGHNPDETKKDAVRREEEKLRAAYRKEAIQRRQRDRPRGLTSGFLEDREYSDEDGSPRPGRRRRDEAPLIGASDSEESDAERRLEDAKEDDSDSDEEYQRKKQHQKKKIVSSDEESS